MEPLKQDVIIADSSCAARLTLWEEDIDRLEEGASYALDNLVVCSFQQSKYLSWPKEGGRMVEIQDIGDVVEDDVADDTETISNAEVVAVLMLENYSECLVCKGKVEAHGSKLGSCTKCTLKQRLDHCKRQMSAKLMFTAADRYVTLNAFGSIVNDIANSGSVTVDSLLSAQPVTITYANNIVTAISRT